MINSAKTEEAQGNDHRLIIPKPFQEASFYQVSSSNGDLDTNTIFQKLGTHGSTWGTTHAFRGPADCF